MNNILCSIQGDIDIAELGYTTKLLNHYVNYLPFK